jgi:hypothetical protein
MPSTDDPTEPSHTQPKAADDPHQSKPQTEIIPPGLEIALRTAGLNPDDPKRWSEAERYLCPRRRF